MVHFTYMKNLSKIVMGACAFTAVSLFAENNASTWNPYVEVKGAVGKVETFHIPQLGDMKFKKGFGGAVEAGLSYQNWRIGLEFAYLKTKAKSIDGIPFQNGVSYKIDNLSGMFCVYHDFAINNSFDIYAGAGVGLSRTKAKYNNPINPVKFSGHTTHFAWQVMTGVAYHINENWSTKVGYRFFKIQSKDYSDVHMLELGLRYNF
ncbi:MAG: outer membrane protein [bacterium]